MDDPEMISKLIGAYPEFISLYERVYSHCWNVEEMKRRLEAERQQHNIERQQHEAEQKQLKERIRKLEESLQERRSI